MPILAYHMVEPRFDLAITRVTPSQFAGQIHSLLQAGYAIETLRDYLQPGLSRERRVALTFDDAYASVYQHAWPLLAAHQLRATLFVPAAYIGKMDDWDVNLGGFTFPHMTGDQICELAAAGWEIGSHTLHHQDLTRLEAAERLEEVADSKRLLEALTGTTVDAISYPFGNTNVEVVACCQAAGYRTGVVMGRFDKELEVNFVLPRLGVYLYDLPLFFEKKVFGKHEKLFNFIQRGIDFCSDGTVLVKQGFGKPRKSA